MLTDYPDHETWNPLVTSTAIQKPDRLNVMIDPDPEDRLLRCDAAIRRAQHAQRLDIDLYFAPAFLLYAKYSATLSASGGGTLLNQEVSLLQAGKPDEANTVDGATGALGRDFEAFEAKYRLQDCPYG